MITKSGNTWTMPVAGTTRYLQRYTFAEAHSGCQLISKIEVVDSHGIDPVLTLFEGDSVWGSVGQFLAPTEQYTGAVDLFIGGAHNPDKQTLVQEYNVKQYIDENGVLQGSTETGDFTSDIGGYRYQKHSCKTAQNGYDFGTVTTHYVFSGVTLRALNTWEITQPSKVKTLYSAMAIGTGLVGGGLRNVEINGKPVYAAQYDGSYHHTTDQHNPTKITYKSPYHGFALVVTLPIGAGRPIGGSPAWDYANLERCFIADNSLGQVPNGALKTYVCFYSGEQIQPAQSVDCIFDVSVEIVN